MVRLNREKYKHIMLCIKYRIHHILTMENRRAHLIQTRGMDHLHTCFDIELEEKALQIRKSLELIATASLIANETVYRDIARQTNINRPNIRDILRKIKKIHPRFYPEPFKDNNTNTPIYLPTEEGFTPTRRRILLDESDEYLRYEVSELTKEQRFETVFDCCSQIIHSNPFNGTEYETVMKYKNEVIRWTNLIINLLDFHTIRLLDEPIEYVVRMHFDKIREEPDNLDVTESRVTNLDTF